jgi:AcrR family transcriptional regulator
MMDYEFDEMSEKRKSTKNKLILKIFPYIQKQGFSLLKMDDAAKYMDISKATMYKYFASKDEIIECLVEQCVNYTTKLEFEEVPQKLTSVQSSRPSHEDLMLYGESFNKAFKLSIKMAFYLSDVFLQDINIVYPNLSATLSQAVEQCQKRLIAYFDNGMELGVFHRMNSGILLIQLDVVLRRLLDSKLLMQHNMTLKQAMLDFYLAFKYQVFNEEWIHEDQVGIETYISEMIFKNFTSE